MRDTTSIHDNTTKTGTGFPPVPPEAHQEAAFGGIDIRFGTALVLADLVQIDGYALIDGDYTHNGDELELEFPNAVRFRDQRIAIDGTGHADCVSVDGRRHRAYFAMVQIRPLRATDMRGAAA